MILVCLEHVRDGVPFDVVCERHSVSPNTVRRALLKATFILDETVRFSRTSRRRPMYTVTAIFDVTTINVAVRDIACWSGKHKRHVVKFQVTTTAQGQHTHFCCGSLFSIAKKIILCRRKGVRWLTFSLFSRPPSPASGELKRVFTQSG